MARFSHLVAKPKATPLLPGENIHDADAGWLATAGSASADAAVGNAADIGIHTHSRQEGAKVSPENADGDVIAPVSDPPVVPAFSVCGTKAPEQPGRNAKTRSRPFRIPHSFFDKHSRWLSEILPSLVFFFKFAPRSAGLSSLTVYRDAS